MCFCGQRAIVAEERLQTCFTESTLEISVLANPIMCYSSIYVWAFWVQAYGIWIQLTSYWREGGAVGNSDFKIKLRNLYYIYNIYLYLFWKIYH